MNWETMTDLIDRRPLDSVQLAGWAVLILIAAIVVFFALGWVRLSWQVYQLNRRRRKAAEALAKRGGRTWPL